MAICIYMIPVCAITQEFNYFSNRLDLNGTNEIDRSYNIVEIDEGYVIAGTSIVYGETIYWWEKAIAKIDNNGHLEYVKYYGEDSVEYFFSYTPDYLIKVGSHFFAAGIRREPASDWFHQEATLMKLDENLDTLWMKRFGEMSEPFDTAYYFASIQEIENEELILTGAWMPHGLATHVYLLKVDSLGNEIWDNSFSYYNFYIEGHSVARTTDTGFIIGCFKQTPGYPNTVDPILIKTDSLGNQEWIKNLGGPYKDSSPFVAIAFDSNIVVGTSYGDTMVTPDNPESRINIIKLDNSGNIIWSKKYGESERSKYLHKIRILNDGSIIAIGSVYRFNPEPDRVSWILKTTSEGDSLWYREYSHLTGYESRNYLYDVIENSDNGLIACGYVDPYPPDTGSIDTWVIKLDSMGCEFAGCDSTVGVEENGGLEDWRIGRLVIWPNPGSGIVDCRLSIADIRSKSSTFNLQPTMMVYNVLGRLSPSPARQTSSRLVGGKRWDWSWQLDVSALPPGIYMAVVRNGQEVIGTGKFVVAR
jgi:hypothetical protein